jgi:hypothetical protein
VAHAPSQIARARKRVLIRRGQCSHIPV